MNFQKSDFEKLLRKSFLGFLSQEDLQRIVAQSQVVEAENLQRVPREEQPQSFFLILSGEVTLRQRGSMFEMDRIGYGHSLELRTLLLHIPQWQYEWQCEAKCFFLKIPWRSIEVILQKYPLQLHYLARITQSVALQRLKRDLLGLNVSRETVVDLISKMRNENFIDIVPRDLSKKMIVTVLSGDVVVQVDDGERPFHLMTLSSGDTTLIDWSQRHLKYLPQGTTRVWVIAEDEWKSLLTKPDFVEFLELFKKKPLRDLQPVPSENTDPRMSLASLNEADSNPGNAKEKKKSTKRSTVTLKISPSDGLFAKLFRPSLLGSVDENRTGTALLVYLMKQAGFTVQHRDIDARVPDEWNDTTLLAFKSKCEKVGVSVEYTDFPIPHKITKGLPVIVQTQNGFCLITPERAGTWILSDFSSGTYREISSARLTSELRSPKCLIVQGVRNIFPEVRKEFKFRHVWRFGQVSFGMLMLFVLGSALGFLAELSLPVYIHYILDEVAMAGHAALLAPSILIFAALTVLGVLISWFNQKYSVYLTNVLSLRLKAYFQAAIFRLRPNVLHTMGASQLLSRIADIDQIANFTVHQCFGSALSLIFMIGNLSVLWLYSPKLAAMILCLLPVGLMITYFMRARIENLKLEQVRTKAKENRLIFEHFSSNDDMRTLKGILPSRWKWDFNANLAARNLIASQKLQAVFQIVQMTGTEAVKICAFVYAYHLYSTAQLTLGQLIAVAMIVPRVTEPIQSVVATVFHYFENRILVSRLNDLLVTPKGNRVPDHAIQTDVEFNQSIQFESVTLQYDSESARKILKNISLEIHHGTKVAFLGTTGSGKSSLAYLMAGFYQPTFGNVRYDSFKKEEINSNLFYQKVALVEQEGRLFAGSILENIALGDEKPDLERAVRCARAVVMDEDILARPGGYGSMILPGGLGLSEGQRQRILIARALYRDPEILILDEATSHLDPISESQVMKNIWELMKDRTVILFTQRIQMTSRVDRVFFIADGQLIEQGSHKDLIQNKQNYYDFYLKHLSIG